MTARIPLIQINGQIQQISGGDTIDPTYVSPSNVTSGVVPLYSSATIGQDCYYNPAVYSSDLTTTTLSGLSGLILGASFVAGRTAVMSKIMVKIAGGTGAGRLARIGIYEEVSSSDPRPSALIYGSADIDCSTAANFVETVSGSPTLLVGRRYWLVAHANDNGIQFLSVAPNLLDPVFGRKGPITSDIYPRWGAQGSQAYAALPSTFPTVTIISSATQPSTPCVGVSIV